jgi:hypothetical protein
VNCHAVDERSPGPPPQNGQPYPVSGYYHEVFEYDQYARTQNEQSAPPPPVMPQAPPAGPQTRPLESWPDDPQRRRSW